MRARVPVGVLLALAPLIAVAGGANPASGVDAAAIASGARAGDWLSYGRTYAETRHSPLDRVHAGNVGRLGLAWHLDLPVAGSLQATPLASRGVLYTTGSWGVVFAIDAASGRLLWSHDPQAARRTRDGLKAWDGNRGVALWQGRLYVGLPDGRLLALDAATGRPLWEVQTTDPALPYWISGAPRVVKGLVVIGNGGSELGTRGYVTAYDAGTGAQRWRFYTVPGDPARGFESPELERAARTWTGEWWKYGGGGNAWNSFAYDPELDLLYFGTGNGSPWNRKIRSPGGGDNLFLCSIVAVDPDTGEYRWHYQTTPGETWDYNSAMDIVLADLVLGGRERKVLLHAPKNGFFYVLDRATGELLSAEKFGKVTWASHVDLRSGRPVEIEGARYEHGPAVVWPGSIGAHNWQAMSFSPRTGLVYIPYIELPARFADPPGGPGSFRFRLGQANVGIETFMPTEAPRQIASGALLAWDPVRQREAWRVPYTGAWNGGTLTTAGNLVFQGTADGRFLAYSADRGERLWEFAAQNGIVGAPITYRAGGEQYVAVLAGWGGALAAIGGDLGSQYGWRYRETPRRVLAFRLDGRASLPAPAARAPATAARAQTAARSEADATHLARGEQLYHEHCALCHGAGAVSGGNTPDLRQSSAETRALYAQIVLQGALSANGMPAFERFIGPEELAAIGAYVDARAALAVGR